MKILIVDDEGVSRTKMDVIVRGTGHETIIAKDGLEGWEIWKHQRQRIVITDWVMPKMDGLELCRKIRENEGSQYTFLIVVTAKQDMRSIITAMDAGADGFISKPFVKDEVAVRIKSGERILRIGERDIVIFSLAKLAESRDPETGNHLERMRFYSKTLAESLVESKDSAPEIDKLFADNIFLTSPLHDIGKIGIPDYILLKPGRLDDKEFGIMKTHTSIGFNTLNDALVKFPKADYLQMSAEIARSHHEKFDGTGYPDGWKGYDIPLSARIVTLSDVYDALVSKRVYKTAYSHDLAKSIIVDEKGNHFDPIIVETFLACENRFIDICNQFSVEK
ncbi:MAG TPA: response regulator [Desulfobacterales bacterium]|nr:response regulator [Desulfobacterales bacterium]